jgi:hypothetical protein
MDDWGQAWQQSIIDSYNNPAAPRLRPVQAGPDYARQTHYLWLDRHVGTVVWDQQRHSYFVSIVTSTTDTFRLAEVRTDMEATEWLMNNVPACKGHRIAVKAVQACVAKLRAA